VTIVDRARSASCRNRFIEGELSTSDGIEAVACGIADLEPDLLINLAGVQYCGQFSQQESGNILENYMVNLIAPVRLTQAVIPGMQQRGRGQIVNIGSILGSIAYPYFVTYSSAKAGLKAFSEALRRELRDSGIDVTYIAPRAIKTGVSRGKVLEFAEMTKMRLDAPGAAVARIVRAIIGRERNVFIGFPESLFVKINAVLPGAVDVALASQVAKARSLFL
jgi:short-subunit dehydrogenase